MPEISLTSWLDPINKYFADKAGIPVAEYSAYTGGELIGNILEVITDFFAKPWTSRVVQGIAGLIAVLYGVFGADVPTRLRRELISLGEHELLRLIHMTPDELREAQEQISRFARSLQVGDVEGALSAAFRTPTEIVSAFTATPTPPPSPPPTPTPFPVTPITGVAPITPAPPTTEQKPAEQKAEEELEIKVPGTIM